jgi:hypothetical protein
VTFLVVLVLLGVGFSGYQLWRIADHLETLTKQKADRR